MNVGELYDRKTVQRLRELRQRHRHVDDIRIAKRARDAVPDLADEPEVEEIETISDPEPSEPTNPVDGDTPTFGNEPKKD